MDISIKQQLLIQAAAKFIETDINHACQLFDVDCDSLLDRINTLGNKVESLGMELVPRIQEGDLETTRILRSKSQSLTNDEVLNEIHEGESNDLEFKSSLLTDVRRLQFDKNATPKDLRSEEVIHSALKTIAGFMNAEGGVLYLGVADDESLCGLEHDLELLPKDKQNWDNWELEFSQLIDSKFRDGRGARNYLQLTRYHVEGKTVARIEVTAREKLTLVKKTQDYILYRRQANRTVAVTFDLLEDFYELKKR